MPPSRKLRLLFVINVGWSFVSHRLPLAIAAKEAGYDVHVATALQPGLDSDTPELLSAKGIIFHELHLSRSGAHPIELLRDFRDLRRLFRRLSPDIVHLVALKPLLLGGIAAKLARQRRVVMAVPGRGSVFSAPGLIATLRRWVALAMYRAAYARNSSKVIVQNVEDGEYFIARSIFSRSDVRLIRGSGADLSLMVPQPEPPGIPVVVFASRMLREKGVEDFVYAATVLKSRGVRARFVLVGETDHGNPHSHTREELEAWVSRGAVEWWGFRSDMNVVFAESHIFCLPTFYGEGVPKVLIEAAACGRPIITTDRPGCRDIVKDGYNGIIVEARDVEGLSAAIERLIKDPEQRCRMGANGRARVESEFSLEVVVRQTLDLYSELL